ncbi:MAG: T9SS type A sorting domain-containing protein [Candidatus Eisenbacteria bacterium]|nr:T9SS type A sorting domain-containing protein [Candidatus Eisenbacteria bacterium]
MIRRTVMLGLLAVVLLTVGPALAADRCVLAEFLGGTWCGYCPESQAALEELVDEEYAETELAYVYYHIGGADPFRTTESQARASWYSVGGVPHVEFDGVETCIGNYENLELTKSWYRGIIDDRLAVASPIEIRSSGQIGSTSGYVTADFVARDTVTYSQPRAQFLLVENGCEHNSNIYHFTLRDMLASEDLTLSSAGDSMQVTRNFTVDPSWEHGEMRLIVFVEDVDLKEIIQANLMPPPYDLHITSTHYAEEIDYSGMSEFTVYVENRGTATDTVTMDIAQLELPDGVSEWDWFAQYCGTGGICYFGPQDFALAPGEIDTFYVEMGDYLGNVQGRAVTEFTAQSNGEPSIQLSQIYGTFVDVPSVLLVDDDGGASHETHLETALADTGYPSMVWDTAVRGRPGQKVFDSFWAALWTTGAADGTSITLADEAVWADYLDAGGNFFIASMDYLSSRVAMTPFIENYLHIDSWSSDVGGFSMSGIYGDQISHDMTLGLSGGPIDNAGNDSFVTDGAPDVTFTSLGSSRGVKVEENGHRVAFIAFPFENVKTGEPAPNNQKSLAGRVMQWFQLPAGVEDDELVGPARLSLRQNTPNPFNPVTTIRFSVPSGAGRVSLDVYSVTGRHVARLLGEELSAGPHSIVWDGSDDLGRKVSSGIYFARLSTDEKTQTIKMTLLK